MTRASSVSISTCWPEELKTVYGPIDRFWMEDENPETLLEFRNERGKLLRNEIPLTPNQDSEETAGAGAQAF